MSRQQHIHPDGPRSANPGAGSSHVIRMIPWAITFLLLALVSAIFTFDGTAVDRAGLYGRAATVFFLVLAIVMMFIRRDHQKPR